MVEVGSRTRFWSTERLAVVGGRTATSLDERSLGILLWTERQSSMKVLGKLTDHNGDVGRLRTALAFIATTSGLSLL